MRCPCAAAAQSAARPARLRRRWRGSPEAWRRRNHRCANPVTLSRQLISRSSASASAIETNARADVAHGAQVAARALQRARTVRRQRGVQHGCAHLVAAYEGSAQSASRWHSAKTWLFQKPYAPAVHLISASMWTRTTQRLRYVGIARGREALGRLSAWRAFQRTSARSDTKTPPQRARGHRGTQARQTALAMRGRTTRGAAKRSTSPGCEKG